MQNYFCILIFYPIMLLNSLISLVHYLEVLHNSLNKWSCCLRSWEFHFFFNLCTFYCLFFQHCNGTTTTILNRSSCCAQSCPVPLLTENIFNIFDMKYVWCLLEWSGDAFCNVEKISCFPKLLIFLKGQIVVFYSLF